jgi:hypothetical protein
MTDMYFEVGKEVKLKTLIKAIHNPEERVKWDKDVEYGKYLEVACDGKALIFH